jgi:hypothetical protein
MTMLATLASVVVLAATVGFGAAANVNNTAGDVSANMLSARTERRAADGLSAAVGDKTELVVSVRHRRTPAP